MRLTRQLKVEDAHDDAVWCCAWVPGDGPHGGDLITGSVDEAVKVWRPPPAGESGGAGAADAIPLEPLHTYVGHTLGAVSVAADATGTYGASASLDSFVRVWSLADASTKAVIETPPGETWQIAFAPLPAQTREGDVILAAAGGASNRVVIWSTNDAEKVAEFCLPEPMADGGGGASAGAAASADPAASAAAPRRSDRFVLSVAYSPDGARLACGSMDGGVHVFDTATGALVHSLAGHFKPVRALAFAPDSRTLVTGCDDMLVHLYDVGTGALVDALSGHESWVLSLAPHPGGAILATGSADATVRLWDLRSRGAALQVAREASDQVWGVAWDAEGRRLAAVSDDKGVVVFAAG